jgi:transposase InsO family protein
MRYSFESRCRAVAAMREGQSPSAAAHAVGASRATGYRWWARYQAGGWAGLQERPSTPQRQPRRLSPAAEAEIGAAREHSGAGSLTLGALLGLPTSTVGKVLRRLGRSRLPREPRPPVVRYERARPGELVHIDTKKLGRFWHVGKRILRDGVQRSPRAGWQHVHVAVDDHSRLAYAEVLPSDRQRDALAFLERALRWFGEQGVAVEAVMTDNGPAYVSHAWRRRCAELGLHHLRTRPYTPRTNGKAERFIQMLLRSWAYAFAYPTSAHRARALSGWLRWYNRRRPHGSLSGLPPISRVSHVRGQYT